MSSIHARVSVAALAASTLVIAGCSTNPEASPSPTDASPSPTSAEPATGTVTVVTHDSFAVPDDVLADFEASSGLTLVFVAPGDAGSLVNQLILTQEAPLGDVVYGVDNTFASRAVDAGVFQEYVPEGLDPAVAEYALEPGTLDMLTPIDFSDVCLNYDVAYFEDSALEAPTSLDQIATADYAPLTSVTNPATSSPGLAFVAATVAEYGDDWATYWEEAADNGIRVTASWSDTYFTDFSAPNYGGDYPIVLSYASSPPSEVIDGEPTTAALLDTCFRQVEYAGVLQGAQNTAGAQAVVDWMSSDAFQETLPTNMYVYPVSPSAALPPEWVEHAQLADDPATLSPSRIDAEREEWIDTWTSVVLD
ncbi:MAG: thiamine ABC transporter substrate-binding protein [Demequina sp.]